MGKIETKTIKRFNGGATSDIGVESSNKFAITKNFDTFSRSSKLLPNPAFLSAEETDIVGGIRNYAITNFNVGAFNGSDFIYGLGQSSGHTYLLKRNLSQGSKWTASAQGEGSSTRKKVLFKYKDYFYVLEGTTLIKKIDPAGVAAISTIATIASFANYAQPVHHQCDDIAYFFTDNKVHSLNNTVFTEAVLTLPSNLKIISARPYGNYLAIACSTLGTSSVQAIGYGDRESVLFLWDRDSSLTTLSDRIDLGKGEVWYSAVLNGRYIAIINYFTDSTLSSGKPKIIVKTLNGNTAATINEIEGDDNYNLPEFVEHSSFLKDEKLYFVAKIPYKGDLRHGIWVVDSSGRITLDTVISDATSTEANVSAYEGIFATGDVWWIAHNGNGTSTTGQVVRTDETPTYSTTEASVYESLEFDEDDPTINKKLLVAGVSFEPLSADGRVILKYRKEEDSSWTTLFDYSTDNGTFKSANLTSNGDNLPNYKRIQFKIESYGGAVINALKYKYEYIDNQLF